MNKITGISLMSFATALLCVITDMLLIRLPKTVLIAAIVIMAISLAGIIVGIIMFIARGKKLGLTKRKRR